MADYGTMGVNYIIGNGTLGLGDMINQSELGQNLTIDLY